MATITGSLLYPSRLGLVGSTERVIAKFSFGSAPANADVLNCADLFPFPVLVKGAELLGDILDTNATPTLAVKFGNSDDDDGFIPDTVIGQTVQTNIQGFGALVGTVITNKDLTGLITAAPATGATGDWYVALEVQRVNYG